MQQTPAQTAQPAAGGKAAGKPVVGGESSNKGWLKWVIIAVVVIVVAVGLYYWLM